VSSAFPLHAFAALFVWASFTQAAAGQAPNRIRWEYDGGFVKQSRLWAEKAENVTYHFIETARNSVYVELFDPTRQYFVRLYPDKLLLRGGTGSAKKIPKFARVHEGAWSDKHRVKWEYDGGFLEVEKTTPKTTPWVETNIQGPYIFEVAKETPAYVELFDRQRDYTIRLYADQMQIYGGNDTVEHKFPKFTKIYAGRWTPGARRGRLSVVVDVSDAPETAKWAAAAKRLCEIWHPIVFDRLYPGRRPPTRTIKIIFKGPSMKGLAYTTAQNSTITISADWIKKHPDDFGMVIHELTHVVQNYPAHKVDNPFWVQEGMADYCRYYEYEPEKPVPINWQLTYKDGYAIASAFLDWIQRNKAPNIIEQLNTRLQVGEYTHGLFDDYAHEPLKQLWNDFVAEERPAEIAPKRKSRTKGK
jgi:hypothetical protein